MIKKEKDIKSNLKQFWNWLWNSESWLSYIVFLILVFIVVKFIFLPGLGVAMNTCTLKEAFWSNPQKCLPLAIVESSSMEHYSLKYCKVYDENYKCLSDSQDYILCDKTFDSQKFFNKENYWDNCGKWYLDNTNITEEKFQSYSFKNGFRKGDLMIIVGKNPEKIKVGDIIVFEGGRANPIIHRVVSLNPIQTKGDHNSGQLSIEKNISKDQVIGTAVARIPYVGWIKLFFVELFNGFK